MNQPTIDHRLFIRATRLDTMREPPARIESAQPPSDREAAPRREFASLMDFDSLGDLLDDFLGVIGLPIALIDLEGNVLASSRWQRLCMDFHRAHPQTQAACLMSDTMLARQMEAGHDHALYRCANGLIDCATPIVIDDAHIANLFTGQFLLDAPDLAYFRCLQVEHGFKHDAYFEALAQIPIVSQDKVPSVIRLLKGIAREIVRRAASERKARATLSEVERQVAERTREISEREEHFRALFEGSPVGQVIYDPHSLRIVECNQAAADTYGYTREELRHRRIADFDVGQDPEALQAFRRQLAKTGEVHFETRVRRKDGEVRDILVNAVVLRSADGDRCLATHRDITEQRLAKAARAKIERAMRLLTDCNDALLHADDERQLLDDICQLTVASGGYLMAWVGFAQNDADKLVRPVAQSGYEEGYIEGIRVSWADDREHGLGPTGTAIRTGATQVNQDCLTNPHMQPWREAARKRGYQASIALPLRGRTGILGALTIYAREPDAFVPEEIGLLEKLADNLVFGIERLRDRIRLAKANAELQGFTYAASHDMRAPLGRISAFGKLIEQHYGHLLEGDGKRFLAFILQNAERLTTLVEDLLAHSQVEQQASRLQAVDLPAVMRAVLEEQREEIRQGGAQVSIDLPPALVQGDPHSLAQALRNLLANALKYSGQAKPPRVNIGGELGDKRYRLWIEDNGIGFDMAYHDRIFEIFRRLHSYSEYPGNGVGLALVKKAVESMGGKVWAQSAPGEGATFFLEFQLAG